MGQAGPDHTAAWLQFGAGCFAQLVLLPKPPTPSQRKERKRKERLRTMGLTPKLEAAKRSEALALLEAVVWA